MNESVATTKSHSHTTCAIYWITLTRDHQAFDLVCAMDKYEPNIYVTFSSTRTIMLNKNNVFRYFSLHSKYKVTKMATIVLSISKKCDYSMKSDSNNLYNNFYRSKSTQFSLSQCNRDAF